MAKKCVYCGKGTTFGKSISHAHNVTNRPFRANLQKIRAFIDGASRRVYACTRCIRSGMVTKPPARNWSPEEATNSCRFQGGLNAAPLPRLRAAPAEPSRARRGAAERRLRSTSPFDGSFSSYQVKRVCFDGR